MFKMLTVSWAGNATADAGASPVKDATVKISLATPKSEPNLRSAFIFPSDQVHSLVQCTTANGDQVVPIPENI